jgi:photosystem II stability/assembly factor-like uncharacterized protein
MKQFCPTYTNVISRMKSNVMRVFNLMVPSRFVWLALAAVLILAGNTPSYAQNATGYQYVTPTDPSIPPPPMLRVIPGNGRVTLYWDDLAESFEDPALAGQNRSLRNFEGYKIYKSTDPEFLDALRITDNQGNLQGFRPIAQFDRRNDIRGYHPASINGMRYWVGTDTGIERFYIDDQVQNGRTYYYAVVAYTHGDAFPGFVTPLVNPQTGQIYDPPLFPSEVYKHSPRESLIDASINRTTGQISLGRNVVEVIPNEPVFGYTEPDNPTVQRVSGSAGGEITVQIIDPAEVRFGNEYTLSFQDTIIPGATLLDPDLVVTRSFTLTNTTTGEVIFDRDERFRDEQLQIREGMLLRISNSGDTVSVNPELSKWTSATNRQIHRFNFGVNTRFSKLADYRIEFSDGVAGRSTETQLRVGNLTTTLPAEDVNFRVFNTTNGQEIPFGFFANPNIPRDLREVFFLNNQLGWAVGGAGQIRITTNGGTDWRASNTGTDERLADVHFVDADFGWAAGTRGIMMHTQDGGDTWFEQTTGTQTNLTAVYFLSRTRGFAIGEAGLLIQTSDGGDSWTSVNAGTTRDLYGMTFADSNTGFIVGQATTILRTTDGGSTWTIVPPAELQGGSAADRLRILTSVNFASATHGWMVGFSGVIWATTDGGTTWSRQPSVNNTRLNKVAFVQVEDRYVGWAIGPNGHLIATNSGGASWFTQQSGVTTELFGIAAVGGANVVIVGQGPTILNTANLGIDWNLTTTEKRFRAFVDPGGQARSDEIYFIEDFGTETNVITWKVSLTPDARGLTDDPGEGDILELVTIKPFTRADVYRFSIEGNNIPRVEGEMPADALRNVRVVPNPYLVTHIGERRTYGPNEPQNELHFTNLPAQCTIRIFNVSGQLVQTINVNNNIGVNRYVWDMRNQNGHMIPYGVYIYHVDAPGVGEHTGKFAVIK